MFRPSLDELVLPDVPGEYDPDDQRQVRRALQEMALRLASRPIPNRPFLYLRDYAVRPGVTTDDNTRAFQIALDDAADQSAILYAGSLQVNQTGPLEMRGPGLLFDNAPHGDSGGPGLIALGSGYTALNIAGNPTDLNVTLRGSGNSVNGIQFGGTTATDDNCSLGRTGNVRVFNLDGFGVQINRCYDMLWGPISVEECGNATDYAFSVNDGGDTSNMSHWLRVQVEKARYKAIYISANTLSCLFENIHSEQATPQAAVDTWYLGGSRCHYTAGRFAALAPSANATLHLNAGNTAYETMLVEDDIDVSIEGNDTLTLINPELQGTTHVKTNQSGRINILSGRILDFTTDAAYLRVFGTHISSLTVGFANNPSDATQARFACCDIDALDSGSTVSAATFEQCNILEGNNLLRGETRLLNSSVTCAGTVAHSSGKLVMRGSTLTGSLTYTNAAMIRLLGGSSITGTVSCGDAGNADILCDGSSTVGSASTGIGVPTAGAHITGQRHYNALPVLGGTAAWVCTASGTPGTWIDDYATGGSSSSSTSAADSKAASAGTAASVADSKGVSSGTRASTADSKALSVSLNTSIADSKAVSDGLHTSKVDSRLTSAGF